MAYIIDLTNYKDERGTLTVIEKVLPFEVKRIYYITGVNHLSRGGHRHMELVEAIICIHGRFCVGINDGVTRQEIVLDNPHQCLIIEVGEWHNFYNFAPDSILLSLASTHYNPEDYIYEPYA
ncbi:MAG TPA: FdtA/QdtA family cupin domain-containing protein [Mucilaginibacter sp.]